MGAAGIWSTGPFFSARGARPQDATVLKLEHQVEDHEGADRCIQDWTGERTRAAVYFSLCGRCRNSDKSFEIAADVKCLVCFISVDYAELSAICLGQVPLNLSSLNTCVTVEGSAALLARLSARVEMARKHAIQLDDACFRRSRTASAVCFPVQELDQTLGHSLLLGCLRKKGACSDV